MRVQLPHREVILDIDSKTIPSIAERKQHIDSILAEEIVFHSENMTVEEYLAHTWKKDSSKAILDLFGYYLSKDSPTDDQKNDTNYFGKSIKEDRFILSERETDAMAKGHPKYKTVEDIAKELKHY